MGKTLKICRIQSEFGGVVRWWSSARGVVDGFWCRAAGPGAGDSSNLFGEQAVQNEQEENKEDDRKDLLDSLAATLSAIHRAHRQKFTSEKVVFKKSLFTKKLSRLFS